MNPHPALTETTEIAEVETSIVEYQPVVASLRQLYARHFGVVYDVSSAKGLQDCRAARAEIRTCRTSLEAKRQEIKRPALERCRVIDHDAKRITEALLAIEDPLDEQIKAEENAAEARREARRRADEERQAELRSMVEAINGWPLLCLALTAQGIREAIARYEQHEIPSPPEIPPHYHQEATGAKERALYKLREMLAARETREAEELRLAAERRAESERQAAEDKRLREERERMEAEREAYEARAADERIREERRLAEERAELDRQRVEHARIERELAEERARINDERVDRDAPPAAEPPPQAEPGTTVMRVRFEKLGGHYHCRVFTSPRTRGAYEKCGDLVFREAEWPDIPVLMRGAEFVEEASEWP